METAAKVMLYIIFVLPAFTVLVATSMILRGYVASVLWAWFIVPGFGLPPISITIAIGVSMLIGMWTMHRTFREVEDPAKKWHPLLAIFVGPLVTLAVGWVVKQFM